MVPPAVAERPVGAPGTLALIMISNPSLTDPLLPSLAVTFTETVSTSAGLRRTREGVRGVGEGQPRGQRVVVGFPSAM